MTEGPTLYLSAFIDELVRSGVEHIVISPGSRSTPLAVLAAEHPQLRVWMIVDERSAGFFALGLAKARRAPVALLCTSGTAAANYMPAIAEAKLARVPLIVLTADRPHELRDVGAPQTIDQIAMYGRHVKWFMEMPIPEAAPLMLRHARMTAARAAAEAMQQPLGPVHLNFPLREPLLPDLDHPELFAAGRDGNRAYVEVTSGVKQLPPETVQALAGQLTAHGRGLIVCGPMDIPAFAEAVTELAAVLGYPVLADPLSQLRSGSHRQDVIIDAYDAFLRDERTAERLEPEVILRFGAMPVSKPLLQYMNRHADSRLIVVDDGGWRDPTLLASDMISADPVQLCRSLADKLADETGGRTGIRSGRSPSGQDAAWLAEWQRLNEISRRVMQEGALDPEIEDLFEGRVFTELRELLPRGTVLLAGNSMPIRDLDAFYAADERGIRMAGNRGANGIDGLVSTAMGISAAGERVVLVLGDLSFYHDMNGLLAAKLYQLPITIIVVNNDGGGIFSFLPQADLPRHYELLFGTPIGLDFRHAAVMYGGRYTKADTWELFREAVSQAVSADGLDVIEVPTDRRANAEHHRRIWRLIAERIQSRQADGRDG